MSATGVLFMAGVAFALPTITTQPRSQSVSLGAKVTFQVSARGVAPVSFQWRFNDGDVRWATSAALILTAVELADAGSYFVVVTDASGSTTSAAAMLKVDPTFTKITKGPIVNDGGPSLACAWGDYAPPHRFRPPLRSRWDRPLNLAPTPRSLVRCSI